MAQEQKIRGDTSHKNEMAKQSPDILLLANTKTKSVRVASDEAGKTDRFDKINHENPPFLQIDKASIVENFLSNYFRQSKDPTEFRIFRAPLLDVKDAAPYMRDLFKEKPSKEILDFADKYEVKPVTQAQKKENENKKVNEIHQKHQNQTLKENKMSTDQETKTQAAPAENASKYRFNEAMINWEQLNQFGISREYLEKAKLLDGMLKGYKTNQLVPVRLNLGSVLLKTDARLSFQQTPEGQVAIAIHGMRKQPEMDKPFYGHVFSPDDKNSLKETGNIGRQVFLNYPGSNEKVACLVSIDKLTNEIVAARASNVFIPEEVSGVKLTDYEKEDLREGKAIYLEGMMSKNGKEFDAHIQINADKRGIDYIFPNDGQFNKETIGGVELTKKQLEDLQTGKSIFVEDMTTKNGNLFSRFVKLNEKGNPEFTKYDPDSPEGNRVIHIDKEICGTRLTHEDKEDLRAGKVIFLENMTSSKGEEFSSFVKMNTETGQMSFSKTQDGFDEKPAFKIPQEVWGVSLKSAERAQLQDGKAVFVENMKGYNGTFSSWIKVNQNQGKLDYYNENPDKPRQNARQSDSSTKQSEKTSQKQEKFSKTKKGQKA